MSLRKLSYILFVALFLSQLMSIVSAQSEKRRRFKEGDEIEYLWVSKWLPGRVLGVAGQAVAIEYEWAGSLRQQRVDAGKLRFAWEARALSPMRTWSDQSKQFQVLAALVGLTADRAQLHKPDGSEVSIRIDKLSEADQRFLAQAKERAGPPVAELPPLTDFSRNSASGFAAPWNNATDLSQVVPDGRASYANVPMGGVGFPRAHFFEKLIRVEPIGGSDGWTVAGTVDGMEKLPSRVLWASLAAGQIKRTQLLPAAERLLAVDPASRQLLTINLREGPRLTLWTAGPKLVQAEGKFSWVSSSDSSGRYSFGENWAAIVSPDRVLHEWASQKFVVWDTQSKREVYRIEQESFFGARPTLSPGKRYLALPEDKRVRVMDSATGKTLASLPVEGGRVSGVAFNAEGTKLAVLTQSQLAVWELGTATEPKRYRADAIGTPFTATVEWVDDNSLLINRETLFDLNLELPVWSYRAKTFEVKSDGTGETTQTVFGGKLCYAVTVGRSSESAFIVGAVDLPGPKVRETIEALDPESLWVVQPDHAVKLEVHCGEYDSQVRDALMQQIANNNWVYDPSASTTIKAEMGRSETQSVTYKSMAGGTESQTVTVTPFYSHLWLVYDGQTAWSGGGSSGAPGVMFMKSGESAQAKADELQKPDPELFSRLDIPEKIFDPSKKKGLGTSLISAAGLTPE